MTGQGGNNFKLKEERFRYLGEVFTQKVMRHWNRLPRKGVDVPQGIKGQVGWNSGQPNLVPDFVAGNPAMVWELELHCL